MLKFWRWQLWALVMVAALLQIIRTDVTADITAFLPGPSDAHQRLLIDQLRSGASTRLVIIGLSLPDEATTGVTPDESIRSAALVKASTQLRERLAALDTIAWVANGDAGHHHQERKRLFDARYLLSPGIMPDALSVTGLRTAFAQLQDQLVSARGSAIRPIAASDPTLESLRLLAQGAGSLASMRDDGTIWLNGNRRSALLVFGTVADGTRVAQVNTTIEQARLVAAQVLDNWPSDPLAGPRPTIDFAGAGYFNARSQQAIGGESVALVLLALTMISALLLWALRTPRLLPLAFLPVASGALAGYAVVGLIDGSIHAMTIGFGVTLLGEAVDYVIYTFGQRGADGRPTPRFWSKLWLAVLTSLIGFAAMVLSGFQGLQQLGLFSIVGLGVAAVCTRFLIPGLLTGPSLMSPASTAPTRFATLPTLARRARMLRWPWVVLTVLAMAWLQIREAPLWQDGLDALSSASEQDNARDLDWRMSIAQPDLRTVLVVHGDDLEQALQRAEALGPALSQMVEQGTLAGFINPATWLPSARTQTERLAALPSPDDLRARIAQATQGTQLNPRAFEPFVTAVARTRESGVLRLEDLAGTITGHWLNSQILMSADGVNLLLLLQTAEHTAPLAPALAAVAVPGVAVLDMQREVESLVATYRHKALLTALIGALGIVIILALRLRHVAAVASMIAALVSSVVLTSAALAAIATSLSVFHLVALLLVVGVASNYTLFFASLPADQQERRQVSLSVCLAATATIIAFALLAESSAPLLEMIGTTVALGALLGLISALVFSREEQPEPTDPQ